ncbi:hypothetical protein [Corynebacterium bovis]|uniref:hypothetical protein n=1 Tax=Corynebacterium bovis TaxID=36808 RepID=UPI000F65278F|nr:hypothetical protein [Corynebacterium bovis]
MASAVKQAASQSSIPVVFFLLWLYSAVSGPDQPREVTKTVERPTTVTVTPSPAPDEGGRGLHIPDLSTLLPSRPDNSDGGQTPDDGTGGTGGTGTDGGTGDGLGQGLDDLLNRLEEQFGGDGTGGTGDPGAGGAGTGGGTGTPGTAGL